MNQAEFARLLGVTPPAVAKWIVAGKIDLGADGLLDPQRAAKELAERSNPAKLRARLGVVANGVEAPIDANDGDESEDRRTFLKARARREHFASLDAEIAFQMRSGEVVLKVDVEREAFELARQAQTTLLGIPDRIAPLLAAETDPHRVHNLLATELHRVIADIIAGANAYEPVTVTQP